MSPVVQELKELEEAAFEVHVAFEACQKELAQRAAALEELGAAYEAKRREVALIRGVEEDIAAQTETQRSALREESAKVRHWEGKARAADRALHEGWGDDAEPAAPGAEELDGVDPEDLQYRLTVLQEEMQRMDVRPGAVQAWRDKDAEYARRVGELEAASAARDDERRAHEDLRKQRLDEFMAGFNAISLKLKEMYQMITLGGDAELELVDSLDPFSEGILFSVRPPKKSWKNIANLSGGEKTLSSLSLVFALHHYKPTPLYVMDEIDAALGASGSAPRGCPRGAGASVLCVCWMGRQGGREGGWHRAGDARPGACAPPPSPAAADGLHARRSSPAPSLDTQSCPHTQHRFPQRVHRGALHQGAHAQRAVCHHLAAEQHV